MLAFGFSCLRFWRAAKKIHDLSAEDKKAVPDHENNPKDGGQCRSRDHDLIGAGISKQKRDLHMSKPHWEQELVQLREEIPQDSGN